MGLASCCFLRCVFVPQGRLSRTQVSTHLCHQFIHRAASMIAGDVVVQITPDTLDPIVVRAIRW